MAKVIVERPRHGSRLSKKGKGYDRRTTRLSWEDQPRREGMKVRAGAGKTLNEHLAPLRRYLEGQLGRRWDKVFADLCRYLDRGSAVQDHVRDHVNDYVAIQVMHHGGELCHADGYGVGRPLRTPFYVCPRTGIVKKNPSPKRWWYGRADTLHVCFLGGDKALVRQDGVWHIIQWSEFPAPVRSPYDGARILGAERPLWDALHGITLWRDQAERIYGRPIHAVAVRRARKREVRRVVNSYPRTNVVR